MTDTRIRTCTRALETGRPTWNRRCVNAPLTELKGTLRSILDLGLSIAAQIDQPARPLANLRRC